MKALMNPRFLRIGLLLLAVLAGVFFYWLAGRGVERTDDATIEARTVVISPKVAGYIATLAVNDNQVVKPGDPLLTLDVRDYQWRLDAAKAALASAEAEAANAAVNAKRQRSLGKLATTQKDVDNAATAEASSAASLLSAKAAVSLAERELADTAILAPVEGTVTLRTAEAGAYVKVGDPLLTLVGTERWVVANFKEVQLTHMRPGQKVDVRVDAYPSLMLKGHVDSIQQGTGARFSAMPPENATGNFVKIVQRVPVKILIDTPIPPEVVLGPGLSVRPTVHVE